MGMDLSRMEDGEQFECTNMFWAKLLVLAEENGWKAEGTHMIDEETGDEKEDWSNAYDVNEGQVVSGWDTEKMLVALEKALALGDNFLEEKDWINSEIELLKEFVEWGRLTDDGLGLDNEAVGFEFW